MGSPAWSIDYRDGSANAYHFHPDTFEYVPVTPAQSSTGTYSGGEPRAGRLDATAVETLWRLVRAFEVAVALHVEDRMKGTGAFSVTDVAGTREFIIARGPELAAFDAFAAALA